MSRGHVPVSTTGVAHLVCPYTCESALFVAAGEKGLVGLRRLGGSAERRVYVRSVCELSRVIYYKRRPFEYGRGYHSLSEK